MSLLQYTQAGNANICSCTYISIFTGSKTTALLFKKIYTTDTGVGIPISAEDNKYYVMVTLCTVCNRNSDGSYVGYTNQNGKSV